MPCNGVFPNYQNVSAVLMASSRGAIVAVSLLVAYCLGSTAMAEAPRLLRTPSYEAPVRADPDDLLMIAGVGFHPDDEVVYEAADTNTSANYRPSAIPIESTSVSGTAPVVLVGTPAFAITARLPEVLRRGKAYKLWVVTANGEWSEPVSINDPRPQWLTPAYVYSTVDFANLGRRLRIVGRNLSTANGKSKTIRLVGKRTYLLQPSPSDASDKTTGGLQFYLAEAPLPASLEPGVYSISVRREDSNWVSLPEQTLEVRPDPQTSPTFALDDPAFGECRPNDGQDDSQCFVRALQKAKQAGGGTVLVPPGTWELSSQTLPAETRTDGFVLERNINLSGRGAGASRIVRREALDTRRPSALLTLTGHNSVAGIGFSEASRFSSLAQSRPIIQLGRSIQPTSPAIRSHLVEDIVITDNTFRPVGRAITDDSSWPITRLIITRNEFGAYSDAIGLPGSQYHPGEPFRIDDSVVRDNRFVPGSYLDLAARQGAIASGMGAAYHVDFSSNQADGSSSEALQDPGDPAGFRAAFFWNMNNNVEYLLVANNRIQCSGDKDGDGEAIALDESGGTFALNGAPAVTAAGADWVSTKDSSFSDRDAGVSGGEQYYKGHWVQVVDGPGLGQVRRITGYSRNSGAAGVTFRVSPEWDVVPAAGATRIIVGREFWQTLIVANDIEHRSPPCRKSNRTGPRGGALVIWAPSADSVIEANQQRGANGILFAQGYSLLAGSCPACRNISLFQTALEIRNNSIDGEYDWSSDCGVAGIMASVGAAPAPESPPPIVGFGISIAGNTISQSDGLRGGAIDIAMTSPTGPPPGNWGLIQNLLIFHNQLRDITGPPPRADCHNGQRARVGIRIEGADNVRDSVLYANQCQHVDTALAVPGKRTTALCGAGSANQCGCAAP
jgi:hypothetical protein